MCVPDGVEVRLHVEAMKAKNEDEDEPQHGLDSSGDPRLLLHPLNPGARPIDGNKGWNDQECSQGNCQQGYARPDAVVPQISTGFVINLVVPDVVIDAQGDKRKAKPHADDVSSLEGLIAHNNC